ncbi:MAG: ABC transporter ATP-binding protein, partial [Cellvibrionales bacterium]|nr:ABC transporter ATP-binding protein [Cellvibrionales bacterium]
MTAVPYLRIDELVVGYGDLAVLRGVDLRLGRGQIGAVLGASGGGKSTLLRAIAGFLRPRAGSIYLGGRLLSSRDRLVAPERRNLGLVYQDYALFPHLTVAQNVGFGLGGKKADERAAICARMLELVRMAGEAGRYPAELSGGQQQRVALARALAAGPDLLLLDEPFSSLDLTLRRELAADLGEILRARGTTALLVTHDQLEACALAERVGVLGDGRLRQWGSAQDLYRCPADPLVAAALGRGSLLEGRVADDGR